jgi:hypothetical protein
MTVALNERILAAPNVLFKQVGEEAVLLNLANETYFGLNPTGARFWQQLMVSATVLEAWKVLKTEFQTPPERLLDDLHDLIDELIDRGLARLERD